MCKEKNFCTERLEEGGGGGWRLGTRLYINAIHHEISGAICSHVMAGGA